MSNFYLRDWNDRRVVYSGTVGARGFGMTYLHPGQPVGLSGYVFHCGEDQIALYLLGGFFFLRINSREWRLGTTLDARYRRLLFIESFGLWERGERVFRKRYRRFDVLRDILRDPSFDAIDEGHAYPLQWVSRVVRDPACQTMLLERWQCWKSE